MESSFNKLDQIKQFINSYIQSTKERGRMHGSIAEIESQWWVLDQISFILEDISIEEKMSLDWGAFLASKGFGAKNATHVIEEKKTVDPYSELNKLRNEYETWRKEKNTKFR